MKPMSSIRPLLSSVFMNGHSLHTLIGRRILFARQSCFSNALRPFIIFIAGIHSTRMPLIGLVVWQWGLYVPHDLLSLGIPILSTRSSKRAILIFRFCFYFEETE